METGRIAEVASLGGWTFESDVGDAAAATISFALMRVDGESIGRTSADNPWVGRYRCGDVGWTRPTTSLGDGTLGW